MNGQPLWIWVVALLVAGIAAWCVWDDVRMLIDPRGDHERSLRDAGISDREARRRTEGITPLHFSMVAFVAFLSLLFYFI